MQLIDIRFSCPHCGQHLEAPPDMSGESIKCPSCIKDIRVPLSPPPVKHEGGRVPHPIVQDVQKNVQHEKTPSIGSRIVSGIVAAVIMIIVMKTCFSITSALKTPQAESTRSSISDDRQFKVIAEKLMKEGSEEGRAVAKDYEEEMTSIDLPSVLNWAQLKRDSEFKVSKDKIIRAKTVVDKYQAKFSDILSNNRKKISELTVSEAAKNKMLTGYDSGYSVTASQLNEMWSLERLCIVEIENVLLLLAASKGWQADGQQILFEDNEDLTKLIAIGERIEVITKKQTQLKNRYRETTKQKLDRLNINY